MAATSLSPLPSSLVSMSNIRAPLSNNPNAVNSPFRTVATSTVASKQKRSYATVQREEAYGQPPPAKKQMLETHQIFRTPPRQQSIQSTTLTAHVRKDNGTQETLPERKPPVVRDGPQHITGKVDRKFTEELRSIRQWQKHYQRIFPSFVFYFENVAADVQVKYTKAVMSLGAREEKFFSNTVTHVVTTRTIPPIIHATSTEPGVPSANDDQTPHNGRSQTINQSIPDRSSKSSSCHPEHEPNTKSSIEAPLTKKVALNVNFGESRRQQGRSGDVLYKARELGMKVWPLEKLERIINVIFDIETGCQFSHGNGVRALTASTTTSRFGKETDLQQLLRNERINGPSDRDLTVSSKEFCLFRGPFIYIHDIEEKQKPIMIREYPKVYHKEDGDWPQFRSVANGKCPFIDEVEYSKREAEREKEDLRLRRQREKEKTYSVKNLAISNAMQPPKIVIGKQTIGKINDENGTTVSYANESNPLVQSNKSLALGIEETLSRENAFISRAGVGHLHDGEPVASGVQPTITSAIRSAMSSTAAQPGIKAGISKEVHGLQRKVLEKKSGGIGPPGLNISQRMTDIINNAQAVGTTRTCKKRNREKSSLVKETVESSEADEPTNKSDITRKSNLTKSLSVAQQEPKPGYCENCLDKFEDFEKHIISRRHRKFAEKLENWKLLDELLIKLARPVRKDLEEC